MNFLLYTLVTLAAVLAMEFVAWIAHRYLMHGSLWIWHEDHHKPHTVHGFFQKNDLFFLVFAVPSATSYIVGSAVPGMFALFFVGVGISIYGMIYFLIHDVYIHQRFKWFKQLDGWYSRGILRAHGAHHANQNKYGCESFGLLLVHPKYFKEKKETQTQDELLVHH